MRFIHLVAITCFGISGTSSAQVEVDSAAVDAIFAAFDQADAPGYAVGIISQGELVHVRGYGMANLEHDIPLAGDTVLRIGSTSKQFTAACALLAEQQGAISLDADIREYLPEMPDYGAPITTRHLLHHTSGIRDYLVLMSLAGFEDQDYYSDEEAYRMLTRQKSLNFPTGTQHLYSNSGYFLVSVIIKRTTGKSLREFAEQHLFGPLKMTSTHFHDDHTHIVKKRADGHQRSRNSQWKIANTTLEMCGDGGVFTTVEDWLRWDANFYEPTVGGQAFIDALQTGGQLNDGTQLEYALGLNVRQYRGHPVVSHGGAFVGFRADALRFPEQQLSIICFANLGGADPSSMAFRVADELLKDQFPGSAQAQPAAMLKRPKAKANFVELSSEQLGRYAAQYIDLANGQLCTVAVTAGGLILEVGTETLPFQPISETEFLNQDIGGRLVFEPASMDGFWRGSAQLGRDLLELAPYLAWDASFMSLDDYVGDFYSEELDTRWSLRMNGDSLVIDNGGEQGLSLSPLALDAFGGLGGILGFERDAFQSIGAFQLSAGRVLGLRFERIAR